MPMYTEVHAYVWSTCLDIGWRLVLQWFQKLSLICNDIHASVYGLHDRASKFILKTKKDSNTFG